MRRKRIYFCIDPESYTKRMMANRGASGYHDYLQTDYAIRKGVSPMVVSNMAFFDTDLIGRGYDVYLCYKQKSLKIEQKMAIPVSWAGKDGPKVIEEEVLCDDLGVYIKRPGRSFGSLLEALVAGVFHEALGIQPYKPEPKAAICKVCGNCGYFMQYVRHDGTPDSDGDCGCIGMNKECYEGVNPFKDDGMPILQVLENEKACGFFKANRTRRVSRYIKDHPGLYVQ